MTAQNDPTWMARRRGPRLTRVEFNPNAAAERDAPTATRAQPQQPVMRRIKGYVAYDLHSLLEHESDADRARPGHPLG